MSVNRIWFSPGGGLGNRMRALDSAYSLAQQLGKELIVFWYPDEQLNAQLNTLFDVAGLKVIEMKRFRFLFQHVSGYKRILAKLFYRIFFRGSVYYYQEVNVNMAEISRSRNTLILQTGQRFFKSVSNYSFLKPRVIFECRPESIGIHIRRGDHKIASEISTIDKFWQRIDLEIEKDPSVTFFLATDDEQLKKNLCLKYGGRIFVNSSDLKRDSISGLLDALSELYTLSTTRKILGSYTSSFSEVASELGQIQLEIVK